MKNSAAAPLIEKPKWSSPMTHSPSDPVAGLEAGDVLADLDHLARPLVAGDERVVERDDVAPFEQLEVGVADADRAGGDEHLVVGDLGVGSSSTCGTPSATNRSAFMCCSPAGM